MNRRDYLKHAAVLTAGAALPGCADPSVEGSAPVRGASRDAWERGAVPVDLSGWTAPEGPFAPYPALEGGVYSACSRVSTG